MSSVALTKIDIVFLAPEQIENTTNVYFRCVGIGADRVTAHNAAMLSCDKALKLRYDAIRAQDVKDFCSIGRWLVKSYQEAPHITRHTRRLGNILAVVSQTSEYIEI